MRHSTILKLLLGLTALAVTSAFVAHIVWVSTADAPRWLVAVRLGGGVCALLFAGGVGGYIRYWQKRQGEINSETAAQAIVLSLAPYAAAEETAVCDFWRRVPVVHLPRPNELPTPHLGLELAGTREQILFTAVLPNQPHLRRAVTEEIYREWPKTEIRPTVAHPLAVRAADEGEILADPALAAALDRQATFLWQEFRLARSHVYALHNGDEPLPNQRPSLFGRQPGDPLAALLGGMDAVHPQAAAGVQILVRPAPAAIAAAWQRRANQLRRQLYRDRSRAVSGPMGEPRSVPIPQPRNPDVLKRQLEQLTLRLQDDQAICEICLRVWAAAPDPALAEAERERLSTAVMAALRGADNSLKLDRRGADAETVVERRFPARGGLIMTAAELGRLMRLPGNKTANAYPRLHQAGADPLPPERRVLVEAERLRDYRVYGSYVYDSGDQVFVGHAFDYSRAHTFISGATGSGKSVCAENLILQDWRAGAAVLVLDPHGALVDDILRHLPAARENDVVVLDAGSPQPFRFNICQLDAPQRRIDGQTPQATDLSLTVEYILEAIAVAENASWETNVNMRDILHHAFLLALDVWGEAASMLAVQRLLENEKERTRLLPQASFAAKPAVDFWEGSFARMHHLDRDRALNAAVARVRAFTRTPTTRRVLGMAGKTFDLADALDKGKLVLVPMPDSLGESGKRLLGAILVRAFLRILMSRDPDQPARRASLFLDELAATVGTMTPYLKRIVAELRKYGAAATFMTQSYATLPRDLQTLLKGQCATQLCFHGAAEDARAIAELLGEPVREQDVLNLRPYRAYARLGLGGAVSHPCLIRALPPASAENGDETKLTVEAGEPDSLDGPWPVETPPATISYGDGENFSVDGASLLAEGTRRLAEDEKTGITWLRTLSPPELAAVRQARQILDQQRLRRLQANPGQISDPAARRKTLSALAIGIPWWLSETTYQNNEDGLADANSSDKVVQSLDAIPLTSEDAAANANRQAAETNARTTIQEVTKWIDETSAMGSS